MTRTVTWLRRVLLLALGLAILVAALVTWLVRSESGARQIINFALNQTDAAIEIGEVNGSLVKGVSVAGIKFTSENTDVSLGQVEVQLDLSDVIKKDVIVRSLIVRDVVVIRVAEKSLEATDSEPVELPSRLALPVDLIIDRFLLTNLNVGDSAQTTQTVIDEMTFKGEWRGTQLSLVEFDVLAPKGALGGSVAITTQAPYPLVFSTASAITLDGFAAIKSTAEISGSLDKLEVQFAAESPYELGVSGTVSGVLSDPQIALSVATNALNLSGIRPEFPPLTVTSDLIVQGSLEQVGVKGRVDTVLPEFGQSSTAIDGVVFTDRIEFTALVANFPDVENGATLDASGQVAWGSATPTVNLRLAWDQLQWPLRGEHQVLSKNGQAVLSGSQSNYSLSADSALETGYGTEGSIKLQATGTPEKIDVKSLRIDALEGQITGSATVLLNDQLTVSAQITGSEINPSSLLEAWPGKLGFSLDGTGVVADSGVRATLREFKGQGELRGYPLSFQGSGDVTPGNIAINGFNIDSGSTRIRLAGTVADFIDVDWSLNSDDLGSLWPGLSGEIESKGVASGQSQQPTLDFSVAGSKIGYNDLLFETLSADVKFGNIQTGSGVAEISVSGVEYGSYVSDSLVLSVRGNQQQHTVNLALVDPLGTSKLSFDGGLSEARVYAFNLDAVDIDSKDLGVWSLVQPVTGSYGMEQPDDPAITLPKTCLTRQSSRLCVGLESVNKVLSADVDVADLPLSLLSHFVPSAVKADGRINGGGSLKIDPNQGSYGNLQFNFGDFQLQSRIREDSKDSTLRFAASTVNANIEPSGEVVLNANFPLVSGGGFTLLGNVTSSDQAVLARPVSGRMTLSIPSAAFIADYIPQLSKVEGKLEGAVDLSGSLRKPELLGNVALSQGQFTFVDPGVQATDVAFSITGKPDNTLAVDASAKSGGGALTLVGEIGLSEGNRSGEFKMSGTAFQVLNTQESQLWATPDVTLTYANEQLKLTGSVQIPRANINIDTLPQGTVKVSKDQIIVGDGETENDRSVPVNAELLLSFGDSVDLSAFGLDANLGGELRLVEIAGKPTTATGEILLRDGKYQAYGQKLDISTGRLVYAGGPIDQPGVDLRATRVPVSGIEVGVSARGTLSQPQFSVFSTPAMPESDQLAYLIFGRPINADAGSENTLITRLALSLGMQGGEALSQRLADGLGVDQLGVESESSEELAQASLVIGKYLSPKLFVSYGIGLLEPVSTLKLEYALNSKWQLITESSSTRNSADAQYTYER